MPNLSKVFISICLIRSEFPHGEHFLFTMGERFRRSCRYFFLFRRESGFLTQQNAGVLYILSKQPAFSLLRIRNRRIRCYLGRRMGVRAR